MFPDIKVMVAAASLLLVLLGAAQHNHIALLYILGAAQYNHNLLLVILGVVQYNHSLLLVPLGAAQSHPSGPGPTDTLGSRECSGHRTCSLLQYVLLWGL